MPNLKRSKFFQPLIVMVDDGTLDTVFKCDNCKEVFRYSTLDCREVSYETYILALLRELLDSHVCYSEGEN